MIGDDSRTSPFRVRLLCQPLPSETLRRASMKRTLVKLSISAVLLFHISIALARAQHIPQSRLISTSLSPQRLSKLMVRSISYTNCTSLTLTNQPAT